MQSIFLSYTFDPHPEFAAETAQLEKAAKIVIESLDLRVCDGVDLAGRAIDSEIERRILDADGLVAIVTPKSDGAGKPITPPYVDHEYRLAKNRDKPAIRLLHESLSSDGMGQNEEFIRHTAGGALDSILKLMRTLALWKRQAGLPLQIEIEPAELGDRFDPQVHGHSCEYQLMVRYALTDWRPATLWREPGATFAYLPDVPEQSKIKLQLSLGNERWVSHFSNPTSRIALARR